MQELELVLSTPAFAAGINEAALSDPTKMTTLPYPASYSSRNSTRFQFTQIPGTNIWSLDFMGRTGFKTLMNQLNTLVVSMHFLAAARQVVAPAQVRQSRYADLLVYGTPGWGKVSTPISAPY
jgi:hypothetical protein